MAFARFRFVAALASLLGAAACTGSSTAPGTLPRADPIPSSDVDAIVTALSAGVSFGVSAAITPTPLPTSPLGDGLAVPTVTATAGTLAGGGRRTVLCSSGGSLTASVDAVSFAGPGTFTSLTTIVFADCVTFPNVALRGAASVTMAESIPDTGSPSSGSFVATGSGRVFFTYKGVDGNVTITCTATLPLGVPIVSPPMRSGGLNIDWGSSAATATCKGFPV